MYEYEYRLVVTLPDLNAVWALLETPATQYTVKYIQHFRCKADRGWEFKKKLRQVMVYHYKSDLWIRFAESKEVPFHRWKTRYYREFKQQCAFRQNIFETEHRYEREIDPHAKLYGYAKNGVEFGLVFELEVATSDTRQRALPIEVDRLHGYAAILRLFAQKPPPAFTLHRCMRKPVRHTNRAWPDALRAHKHDGIFGHVYSYADYIYEEWEDGEQRVIRHESLGNGFVYGAERLEDRVILLYVAQVRGLGVHNVRDVLLNYLRTVPALDPPVRYRVQCYYETREPMKRDPRAEGVIYHTNSDKIYKTKRKLTLDLLYENGFFVTREGLIQCYEKNLKNGTVYECDLDFNVLRPRHDRFLSNTPKQMKQILKCGRRQLRYSFLFDPKGLD